MAVNTDNITEIMGTEHIFALMTVFSHLLSMIARIALALSS